MTESIWARCVIVGWSLVLSAQLSAAPDRILIGDIVTMNEAQPRAEAVAVEAGRIVAVGSEAEILDLASDTTDIARLEGAVLPGFVDAHGHIFFTGLQGLLADLFPPPDGGVRNISEIQGALRTWASEETLDLQGGWIVGMGYDDAELEENRHPNRHELDAVSPDRPVLIMHQSGHLGVINSAAMAMLGIDANTPDPRGGHIRRDENGEPNGVLEETAFMSVSFRVFADLGTRHAIDVVRAGVEAYAENGFTTAQDGSATREVVQALQGAGQVGALTIDVIAYPQIAALQASTEGIEPAPGYVDGLRIGGTKLMLDGSPQGKTAWLSHPYHVAPQGRGPAYRGYPIAPDEIVEAQVQLAFENEWPVLAHANGDAAAQQLIVAVQKATDALGPADRRTVMIHAQTVREDQLDRMAELDMIPSFFSAHTFYWGDWHRDSVLGPERADRISPTASALRREIRFTAHHDAPVVRPSGLRIIQATSTRRTRSGDILGPLQRVDVDTAIRSTTLWAARQAFEEDEKGSIEVGKQADFVHLSGNPLDVDPDTILDLEVLGTINDGQWIWLPE